MYNKSFNRKHDIKERSAIDVYSETELLRKQIIYKRRMKIDWLKDSS